MTNLLIFAGAGLFAGILAGFLGIGGGTVLVPLLLALGYDYTQSVATSNLSIVITAISGSLQNWRMGYINFKQVIGIGFPALITAQVGAFLTAQIAASTLKIAFGLLLLLNVYLVGLRKRLKDKEALQSPSDSGVTANSLSSPSSELNLPLNPLVARIGTGSAAGLLAGLFGVGGGVILVPMQILLLGESLKTAIQTSLGIIVITSISATVGHAIEGNVLFTQGLLLGAGGFLGAQISTRFLPKLPDKVVSFAFRGLLVTLAIYVFWQA
jgi:uncharacterized membrane protein YfcA